MNLAALFDPTSAAIVVGGTALATFLRCGTGDCRLALAAWPRSAARASTPTASARRWRSKSRRSSRTA